MNPRILIVDDEEPIRNMLAFSLDRADMQVDVAEGGNEALEHLQNGSVAPDLIVLDWMMRGLDGMQLTRTLRNSASTRDIPIIMLTARGKETDRTLGLDSGADDYVVKPFSIRELISRIRAVLRRSAAPEPAEDSQPVQVGDLVLDPRSHRVLAGERPVNMGPTEYRMLRLFMDTAGRAWSRDQLLSAIWGDQRVVEERTVDVHIRRLRKALEPTGHAEFVQTVRGYGYRFSDVVS